MSRKPRKARIYRDELKEKMTGHWDWDMLSREELAREIEEGRRERLRYKLTQTGWILLCLFLLCLYPTLIHWLGRLWQSVWN